MRDYFHDGSFNLPKIFKSDLQLRINCGRDCFKCTDMRLSDWNFQR